MRSHRTRAVCILMVIAFSVVPMVSFAAEHIVNITLISFEPPILTVPQGDTVKWTNNSGLLHTSTSGPASCTPDGNWDTGLFGPGTFAIVPMNTIGTFEYYCIPHCLIGMVGTIIVEAPVPTNPTTWGKIKSLYNK